MKLKMLAVMSAAAVFTGGIASCGSSDAEGGKSSSCSKLSGEYCTIVPVNGQRMSVDMSLDEYLDYSRDSYESLDFKELVFDGSSFEMSDLRSFSIRKKPTLYGGSYEVSDGRILFEYQTTTVDMGEEKKVYDIADGRPHYDHGIVERSKNASDEEWQAEMDKMIAAAFIRQMEKFNETGTFCEQVGNSIDFSDKVTAYNIMPFFVQNVIGAEKPYDTPLYLYPIDDMICVPTYGTKLRDSYHYGNDFTIDHNALAVYLDDEYSRYYVLEYEKNGGEKAEKLRSDLEQQLGSTDDTRIEFSEGKWNWYSSDGELINNGVYQESKEYEGLIAMSVTEDSVKCEAPYKGLSPIFFYIDGSDIWLPYMIKAE